MYKKPLNYWLNIVLSHLWKCTHALKRIKQQNKVFLLEITGNVKNNKTNLISIIIQRPLGRFWKLSPVSFHILKHGFVLMEIFGK